ncbi:transposase, partial [Streptococcus pneumoniae]|uniref:transposase n=1 Tax=Streptococcus pneumoniae TaxID=1313 RepID=UPI00240D1186
AKLEATNNLIKLIKRNAFGFRNFENFKKRIFIALNIKPKFQVEVSHPKEIHLATCSPSIF